MFALLNFFATEGAACGSRMAGVFRNEHFFIPISSNLSGFVKKLLLGFVRVSIAGFCGERRHNAGHTVSKMIMNFFRIIYYFLILLQKRVWSKLLLAAALITATLSQRSKSRHRKSGLKPRSVSDVEFEDS
jgi:hypothetical protein